MEIEQSGRRICRLYVSPNFRSAAVQPANHLQNVHPLRLPRLRRRVSQGFVPCAESEIKSRDTAHAKKGHERNARTERAPSKTVCCCCGDNSLQVAASEETNTVLLCLWIWMRVPGRLLLAAIMTSAGYLFAVRSWLVAAVTLVGCACRERVGVNVFLCDFVNGGVRIGGWAPSASSRGCWDVGWPQCEDELFFSDNCDVLEMLGLGWCERSSVSKVAFGDLMSWEIRLENLSDHS